MAETFIASDGTQLPILELTRNYERAQFMSFGIRLMRETVDYIGNTYEKLYEYNSSNGFISYESNWLLVQPVELFNVVTIDSDNVVTIEDDQVVAIN